MSSENHEFASIVQVASLDLVMDLKRRLISVEGRLERLEKYAAGEWLSRDEAMRYLSCKSTKLWELTKSCVLEHAYVGNKPLYSYESCRKYLIDKSVSAESIELAFYRILASKAKK